MQFSRLLFIIILFFVNNSVRFAQAGICNDGMIGYWKFDAADNITYQNATGPLKPAIANEQTAPFIIQGLLGGAVSFNGKTTMLNVAYNPSVDFAANSNFSIEFWYSGNKMPTSDKSVIGRYIPGVGSRWFVGIDANTGRAKFYMSVGNNSIAAYGKSIVTDPGYKPVWHHIVATRNVQNGVMKVYVDGVLGSSSRRLFNAVFSSASAGLNIGWLASQTAYSLEGNIDELAVYNTELSSTEILQHYNNGLIGTNYCGVNGVAPIIISKPGTNANVGVDYHQNIFAVGTPVPNKYSLVNFPAGMQINPNYGNLLWVPKNPGIYDVTLEVSNGINPPARQSFKVNVSGEKVCFPGIISYWRMDDTIPGFYKDYVGSNNGTSDSPPLLGYGLIGGAMYFNGINNKIDIPANPSFDFSTNESFSVEFYFSGFDMPTSSKIIIGRYFPATGAKWFVGIDAYTGRARFYMSDGITGTSITGSSLISQGMIHVAATRDGMTGLMKIYINGSLEGSAYSKFTRDFSSPTANLNIGYLNRFSNTYLKGGLDEVAIYNSVLSDSAIVYQTMHGYWDKIGYCNGGVGVAPVILSKPVNFKTVTYQGINYAPIVTGEPAPKFSLIKGPEGMTIDPQSGSISWIPYLAGKYDVTIEANNGINPPARQSFSIEVIDQNACPIDMISYWKMDETTPGSYADIGGTNNGFSTAPPVPVQGKVKGAQQFNGTTSKIDIPSNSNFDFISRASFSVEFWYKGNTIPSTQKSAIGRYFPGNGAFWFAGINANDGRARFYISGGGSVLALNGTVITDGNWHYIAAARNGLTGLTRLYVDGIIRDSAAQNFTTNFYSDKSNLNIGWLSLSGNYALSGALDEIAIYKKEITLAEVQQHYSNGLNGVEYCNFLVPLKQAEKEQIQTIMPSEYQLFQNFPNPFNPITKIRFSLPEDQVVRIKVYDQLGKEITELVNSRYSAGTYEVEFDGNNLASGLYFYRMNAGAYKCTKKLLLIK